MSDKLSLESAREEIARLKGELEAQGTALRDEVAVRLAAEAALEGARAELEEDRDYSAKRYAEVEERAEKAEADLAEALATIKAQDRTVLNAGKRIDVLEADLAACRKELEAERGQAYGLSRAQILAERDSAEAEAVRLRAEVERLESLIACHDCREFRAKVLAQKER